MNTTYTDANPGIAEFIGKYQKWRQIYSYAGKIVRDEPAWEGERLDLRYGYPHLEWTAYIIDPQARGYNVLTATTERRNEPAEGLVAYFSHIEDAGKYILWYVGESLRMYCQLRPLTPSWRAAGLDPRVKQISVEKYVSKYELLEDPSRYFVLQAGGVQPENRLFAPNLRRGKCCAP